MSAGLTSPFFAQPAFHQRATVDEQGLPTPWFGLSDAIPWPTPPLPDAVYLSFYGKGPARTPRFRHSTEASVRLLLETGRGQITLEGEFGQNLTEPLPLEGVATLLPIPGPAVCGLQIETTGSWALTVVWFPNPVIPGEPAA